MNPAGEVSVMVKRACARNRRPWTFPAGCLCGMSAKPSSLAGPAATSVAHCNNADEGEEVRGTTTLAPKRTTLEGWRGNHHSELPQKMASC